MMKQHTKKKRGSSSSAGAASSAQLDSEQNLAKALIAECEGQRWAGTLEYWMSARIAELLDKEKGLKNGKAKEACRKECSSLICQLKIEKHRRDPNSLPNSINRHLGILTDAGNHAYWNMKPKEPVDLDKPIALRSLVDEELLARMIALQDEQRQITFLLATDDLKDASVEAETDGLDPALLAKFIHLRADALTEQKNKTSWRTRLNKSTSRKRRMSILMNQMDLLAAESLGVCKEIARRG